MLLNLFDDPALMVDMHKGQIVSANSQLLKLTAFTHAELVGADYGALVPDLASAKLIPGEEKETLLKRRQREPLSVISHIFALDSNNIWMLIVLTPLVVIQQTQTNEKRQDQLLQALIDLSKLADQPDLASTNTMAMRIGRGLFDANLLCIYQADPLSSRLQKIASWEPGPTPFFPDFLPSLSIIRLDAPYIWLPGKKANADIHRAARIANMYYLASFPLGQENGWQGLLLVGDDHSAPVDNLIPLMEILGDNLVSAYHHHDLLENLNRTVQNDLYSQAIHNTVSEYAQEGIILLKPDLSISQMNPAAELILGYASQEVIGKPVDNVLIGAETISSALKSALQGIPTHNLGNITLHRRSGQSFLAHIQTIPVIPDNTLLNIVVFLSDVSENEQIRVRTQQLEQRAVLGEVTAIFAHEVRNPINNLSTGLQLMSMNLTPEDPNQEVIDRLQHDCSRLTHLMESVLSFSRPMEYKLEPTDLSLLLKRILDRWQPRMSRVNITPFFQAAPELPMVDGDPRALEQVFTNLISNAVQAMTSSGGTLAVKIASVKPPQEQTQVEVTVSDSGAGIPDEIRDHIFEPFVTTNPQGTGLGLAITRRIVTAHKGSINVTSFPGGTMFSVCFPAITGEDVCQQPY
ncbi:MAG: ATP-binding protein [Chloroflexi bacterium]|nr:ATP-binding protein [Chloroflexota bacterium]